MPDFIFGEPIPEDTYYPYRWRELEDHFKKEREVRSKEYTEDDLVRDIKLGKVSISEMIAFMTSHNVCFFSGCTTCGGEGARRILSKLNKEEVIRLVEESAANSSLWHEVMVQVLRVYPAEWFARTHGYRVYCMIEEMYDRLVNKYCWDTTRARREVERSILIEHDLWMDLESAKMPEN